ncbi:EG45-like domain containing protein 2 [Bidens hawaiensis]|uniref:EG45-like domain containing protein 2 n=1 Tax=Bidens hawaiensis TaxID=980011 RepID=UPI0040496CE8
MDTLLQCLPMIFFLLLTFPQPIYGKIGTSVQYGPPFAPTACYGNDLSQFSSGTLFAAAGDEIWDNGAACGRRYMLECISAPLPGTWIVPGRVIQVKIIDRARMTVSPASKDRTTIVLSDFVFALIANTTATDIFIDYKEYA